MNLENRIPPGSYFQYSPTGIHGPLHRSSSLTDRERLNLDSCLSNYIIVFNQLSLVTAFLECWVWICFVGFCGFLVVFFC